MEKIIDYIENYRRGQNPPVIFLSFVHILENANLFGFLNLTLVEIIVNSHHQENTFVNKKRPF